MKQYQLSTLSICLSAAMCVTRMSDTTQSINILIIKDQSIRNPLWWESSLVMTLTQFSQLNGLGYCVSRGCPMLYINSAYLILLSFTWVNIAQCFAANSRGKLSCLLHQWSMSKDAGKIFASWGTWWQIGSWLLSLIKKATATTSTTLCFLVKDWDCSLLSN